MKAHVLEVKYILPEENLRILLEQKIILISVD
nr:MAG TPA: hypothetical protein [Bacteriophage sp.]